MDAGSAPRYGSFTFTPEQKRNTFLLALSPDERGGSARIGQEAFFSLSAMEAGMRLTYTLHVPGRGVYIHCAEGRVQVEGHVLNAGDAIGVYDTASVAIGAEIASELILVETPMHRGIHV